jgi:hypothetical protein
MRLPRDVAREDQGARPLVTTPLGKPIPPARSSRARPNGDDGADRRCPPQAALPPVGSVPAGDLDHQSAAVQQVTDTRPSLLDLIERERYQRDATRRYVRQRPVADIAYRLASWYRLQITPGQVAELLQRPRTPARPVGTAPD